jgi:hypothetical protein
MIEKKRKGETENVLALNVPRRWPLLLFVKVSWERVKRWEVRSVKRFLNWKNGVFWDATPCGSSYKSYTA